MKRLTAIVWTVAMLTTSAASVASAQPYREVAVTPLPGTTEAVLTDFNNSRQGVGFTIDASTPPPRVGPAFVWDPVNGTRPFPLADVVGRLAINNNGLIAGTQRIGGRFQVFSLAGSEYRFLPTPPGDFVGVVDVTDSGIVHLTTGGVCDRASWAVYASQLYDLRGFGTVQAIGEDGTIGGIRNGLPFLRALDGRQLPTWGTAGSEVTKIGPAGHFAGSECGRLAPPTFYYGRPDGTVAGVALPFPRLSSLLNVFVRGLNRGGDVVGKVREVCGSCGPAHDGVFLYRDGRVINLTEAVPLRSGQLFDVQAITDDGSIAATAAVGSLSGGQTTSQIVLLSETVPGPPTGLTFTVAGRAVILQWQRSPGAIDYIVQAGSAPGQSDFYNQSVGAQTAMSGIVPPGRYHVRVRARNGSGVSVPSQEIIIDVR